MAWHQEKVDRRRDDSHRHGQDGGLLGDGQGGGLFLFGHTQFSLMRLPVMVLRRQRQAEHTVLGGGVLFVKIFVVRGEFAAEFFAGQRGGGFVRYRRQCGQTR